MEIRTIVCAGRIKKIILIVLIVAIIIGCFFAIYVVRNIKYRAEGMANILEKTSDTKADLTEYIVYGTHLNLKGEICDKLEDVKEINLVFAHLDRTQEKVRLNYEVEDEKIIFSTSSLINKGINLERLDIEKHYLLIEVQYEERKSKYYSIENKTKYN